MPKSYDYDDAGNFDDYDDDYRSADYDEDFEEECGLGPDGLCSMAGTEHCDWECGRLNAERITAMKAAQPGRKDCLHFSQCHDLLGCAVTGQCKREQNPKAKTTTKRAKVKAARKQRQRQ